MAGKTPSRSKETVANKEMTMAELDAAAQAYAMADAQMQELNANLDQSITELRASYAAELTKLAGARDEAFAKLKTWGLLNKDKFDDKRSINLTHGVLGFRLGNNKLAALRGFTLASALELVKVKLSSYVRVKEELNKEALINDRQILGGKLSEVGLEVIQEETVYFEPKKEGDTNG